jgi:hypothetical protein
MELWPRDLWFEHPKMQKRFLEGGTLVWWAFVPRPVVLFR